MKKNYFLKDLSKINFEIKPWDIIFLYWDLASWKTTLSKHIIWNTLWVNKIITSPTYNYYNKYSSNIYHFDLYRLEKYDEFFSIWWEDILDDKNNISIIEWPNLLEDYYKPSISIYLRKTENDDEREIEIIRS